MATLAHLIQQTNFADKIAQQIAATHAEIAKRIIVECMLADPNRKGEAARYLLQHPELLDASSRTKP